MTKQEATVSFVKVWTYMHAHGYIGQALGFLLQKNGPMICIGDLLEDDTLFVAEAALSLCRCFKVYLHFQPLISQL